jgi:hypothetical protein
MPITVILDTNVYSSDKFRLGQPFRTLGGLCKSGHVKLLLPYIIKREFETQLEANAAEMVSGFQKAAKRLAASPIPNGFRGELDGVIATLKAQQQEVVGSHKAHFLAWLKEHAVTELPLSGEHAVAAMENYFLAGPPFKSAKNRDDIPDAMIYQALIELVDEGPVVFICNDLGLKSAICGIGAVTQHKDLNEFIASNDVQTFIAEQDAIVERPEVLLKHLTELASTSPNLLVEFVSEHGGEGLASTHFSSPSIPSDDREAYISLFGSLDDVEFDWSRAAYHGGSVIVVPFSAEGEFGISYYVPKWDAEEIERRGGSYSYHNDYVVEADEQALLAVKGTLRIKVSEGFKPGDDIADAIDEMTIETLDKPVLVEDLD